jgi:quercetin dioxygenase-like cupin family protein
MEAEMPTTPLRRIVTGHNAAGRAVVTADTVLEGTPIANSNALFTLVWTTATAPVDNDDATDGRARAVGLTLPGGSVLRVVELLPGTRSAMHRTNSLDYGIVLTGTVELELDDAAVTLIEAGSIVIQRGTMHAWRNPSAHRPARIAFVLLDATPATVNNAPLPDVSPRAGVSKS